MWYIVHQLATAVVSYLREVPAPFRLNPEDGAPLLRGGHHAASDPISLVDVRKLPSWAIAHASSSKGG